MSYRLIVPPDMRREIRKLPVPLQHHLRSRIDDIADDPFRQTDAWSGTQYGPVHMRSTGVGPIIVVVTVNEDEHTVTVANLLNALAD